MKREETVKLIKKISRGLHGAIPPKKVFKDYSKYSRKVKHKGLA